MILAVQTLNQVLLMKKPNIKDTEEVLLAEKPRVVRTHSFGSGLLDGTPRSGFTMSSSFKVIIAGPTSRSSFRESAFQATGTS